MEFGARRRRAVVAMRAAGLQAFVATHAPDVRWLTGFTGSSGAVALLAGERGAGRAVLFTDGRYTTQAKDEAAGVPVRIVKGAPGGQAAAWLAERGAVRCGFDGTQTTVAALAAMRKALPESFGRRERSMFFAEADGLIARLREVKDADEIAAMRRAAALGCELFGFVLPKIVPGATELEVALALEGEARRRGAEAMSFDTIVASGERSALPHGRATTARLPKRGFVTLDFGVVLDGYCSDMTRTVHLGKATRRERGVYDAVLNAQMAGVGAVVAGARCGDVDEAAREILRAAGLAKWFVHSTGHGVGLEIHEGPRVAAKQEQLLEPGMVITIEPGVYLPGEFGVRIEDSVVVTAEGVDVITAASDKQLLEL